MKPSFGQVLGYIQEGEPLALDLPKRNASIYTSSHFYLDDYPNAPEPVSETSLPHTSINPAAAFETADEGYDGVPFPRPLREFTKPSFLPDSDDGGADPGRPAQAPDSGRPAPRKRHPSRGERAAGRRRLAGPHAAHPQAPAGTGAASRRGAGPSNHRKAQRSGAPAAASGAEGGGGGAPGGAGHRTLRLAADGGGGSNRRLRFGGGSGGRGSGDGGGCGNGRSSDRPGRRRPGCGRRCGRSDRGTGGRGGAAVVGTAWAIEGGVNAASHMLGWGAETGGGTDSDASRAPHTTDVQTLNGTQDSGAVDHFFIQEQRQQPRVFRIDTDSESEPRAQPQQQIRARPIRRQGQGRQQPTPFGINQVPIPVSSGSERSRISRQSRGDRGPLATPSFDALRTASEPEAA